MPDNEKPVMLEIIESLFLNISEFKGQKRVDLRKYYQDKDNEWKPTKKGINFDLTQWEDFIAKIDDMNEYVNANK